MVLRDTKRTEDPSRSQLKSCTIGLNFPLQNPHILVERMVARALKFAVKAPPLQN